MLLRRSLNPKIIINFWWIIIIDFFIEVKLWDVMRYGFVIKSTASDIKYNLLHILMMLKFLVFNENKFSVFLIFWSEFQKIFVLYFSIKFQFLWQHDDNNIKSLIIFQQSNTINISEKNRKNDCAKNKLING